MKNKVSVVFFLILQSVTAIPFPQDMMLYSERLNSNSTNTSFVMTEQIENSNPFAQQKTNEPEIVQDDEKNTTFQFRGPNLFAENQMSQDLMLSEEDLMIRNMWGGNCTNRNWRHCSHIKVWGGDYFVKDKQNPEISVLMFKEIDCFAKTPDNEKYFCLANGWTVSRCHLMCMSQCNKSYLTNYDKLVSHEGQCVTP